jgi:hypothetical protein
MKDNFIFSNNSFDDNENEEENKSLFNMNHNSSFQNQDSTVNYFNNVDLEMNQEAEINNNNGYCDDINDFDIQDKDNIFSENENNLNKDFALISPISINDEDSCKMINKNNFSNNEISKEEIIFKDINSSGTGADSAPLSTGGTGVKDHSKDNSLNNINNNIINGNFISFLNENKNNTNTNNSKKQNGDKTVLSKKRKTRIHLEDLNIDPEIIKYKKYQTIGDKVITSKNSVITDMDKKEIRAIRNRISAQKSRDRKKAELLNLQMKLKYLTEQIEKQNLVIQNFEKVACPKCKSKLAEINKLYTDNNTFKIPLDQSEVQNEKEELVLDESSSTLSGKKSSIVDKIAGTLLAVVCLIGIILCVVEGGYTLSYGNNLVENQLSLRHLSSNEIYEKENKIIDNNHNENININVPLPIKTNSILKNLNLENNMNKLQLYHDKFGLDIYSFLKKQKIEKIKKVGFLLKKSFHNNDSLADTSMCIETKSIEHNNYIIDNNLKNTLPVEANNIVLDNSYNELSHRIISLFVKDYDILKRFYDGKPLSLQEQIETEAKNSEDGCVYLQMIIPRVNNFGNNNDNYTGYENDFFEIRCKIFAYNNYYDSKVTPAY